MGRLLSWYGAGTTLERDTMQLTVLRKPDDGKAVMGELLVDGAHEAFTLEPCATAAYPTIPAGTYPIKLLESPRFGIVTPHVQNVPGRSFIEIHPGNSPEDTEGCLLVGETQTADWVGSSRYAFLKLMALLERAESIEITYQDASPNLSTASSGAVGG
jgi:Family of unknown function (DUF5675)